MSSHLPTGSVTFLFTDIEGSTKLVQELGERYEQVLDDHHLLMRTLLRDGGGVEVSTEGDAFFVVFQSAVDAALTAAEMQQALAEHGWIDGINVRVRMGLHTGEGQLFGDDYGGLDVHKAARVASAAHGGQILVSEGTRVLIDGALPGGLRTKYLGEHRLKDLERPLKLFQLCVAGLPSEFPPPRTLDVRPNNLPQQLTPFVARHRELKEVMMLLHEQRLVTLTGPGGTGKTRLSLEAATHLMHTLADGAFVVFLAPVTDIALVPSAIAEALGIREEGTTPIAETLEDHLQDKELLLVLDNFEQILEASSYISDLLVACPKLKVLTSSRGPLHISGEHEYPVPPMTVPDPARLPPVASLLHYEAVDLFVQRARAVDPGFMLDEDSALVVARICRRLDGLPLAIELAAARLRVLSLTELLKRLDRSLAVLTGGARDLSPRQQTLRNAIAWSYDLLDEPTRRFFRRLGVFVEGWSFDAVDPVVDPDGDIGIDSLDALEGLVDHSLIRRSESDAGDTRFRMLQTIREFAQEVIDEEEREATLAAHARYFGDYALSTADTILVDEKAVIRLGAEHDNLRAALRWHVESQGVQLGIDMAAALWRFWQLDSHLAEGRRWLEEMLSLPGANEDDRVRARAETALGNITYWQNDWPETRIHYERAVELFRALDDKPGLTEALYNAGFLGLIEYKPEVARPFYEESRVLAEETGNREALGNAHWGLAMCGIQERSFEEAEEQARTALEVFEELGGWFGIGLAEFVFYQSARLRGDYETAFELVAKSYERMGSGTEVARWYGLFELQSDIFIGLGAVEKGILLTGAAAAAREAYGGGAPPSLVEIEDPRQRARLYLDEARIAELFEEGRKMPLDEAVRLALKDPRSS